MSFEEKRSRLMRKLNISEFDTADALARRQTNLLRLLEGASIDPDRIRGLKGCDLTHCGRHGCSEACWFGIERRKVEVLLPGAYKLLKSSSEPMYEVRVSRGFWAVPTGSLHTVSIPSGEKLVRRALDKLFVPDLVSVGWFKTSFLDELWVSEMHLIIVGAKKDELETAFSVLQPKRKLDNTFWIRKVSNLGATLNDIFDPRIRPWNPLREKRMKSELPRRKIESEGGWQTFDGTRASPSKKQSREYYLWLIDLSWNECLFRYGCDKYFNKLEKQSRPVGTKVRKKHPYPHWLETNMFGNHPRGCTCRACTG